MRLRNKWLATVMVLPLLMGGEGSCKARDDGETNYTDSQGNKKCLRKELASLKDRDPDPTKLECDERILWLVVLAGSVDKSVEFKIGHNAWGNRFTETTRYTIRRGATNKFEFKWQEAVVTYKDRLVTLRVESKDPQNTDSMVCFIYDKPEPWDRVAPIGGASLGRKAMRERNGKIECDS